MNVKELGVRTDVDVLLEYLNVKETFLIDAGCGNMHLSKTLADNGASVLAIDPDPVQAEKNRHAPIIANVGFTETGADQLPVETGSVDGVFFPYSFHHIPAAMHHSVINEVKRVLNATGFVYIMEPVASGDLNDVMQLFHDEREVRAAVQKTIDDFAISQFREVQVLSYTNQVRYASWEDFASRYANKSYNTRYTEAQVRDSAVQQRFEQHAAQNGHIFDAPMRITLLRMPHSAGIEA